MEIYRVQGIPISEGFLNCNILLLLLLLTIIIIMIAMTYEALGISTHSSKNK